MEFQALTVIDVKKESQVGNVDYLNMQLWPFYWHFHPNSDETFLVMEGSIYIDLETHTVELLPGQLFTIPMNVKHRTRPKAERSVNLTFEHAAIETVQLA